MIIYTNEQLKQIELFKIETKVKSSNGRFKADKISKHDVLTMLEKFKFRCLYCDSKLKPNGWHLDHFNSKAMGGKNVFENLAPSCKWCNLMKGALDGYAFLNRCKFINDNNFLKKTFGEVYYNPITNEKKNS